VPLDTVLDGEIVIAVEHGNADFGALQQRLGAGKRGAADAAQRRPAVLLVFDLLRLAGSDLTAQPLHVRRAARVPPRSGRSVSATGRPDGLRCRGRRVAEPAARSGGGRRLHSSRGCRPTRSFSGWLVCWSGQGTGGAAHRAKVPDDRGQRTNDIRFAIRNGARFTVRTRPVRRLTAKAMLCWCMLKNSSAVWWRMIQCTSEISSMPVPVCKLFTGC